MTGPAVRAWSVNIPLKLDRRLRMPIYHQLVNQLIGEVRRGRLLPGSALPGTRELATELNINRKTVVIAYDELVAQGWFTASPMRGTFVSTILPKIEPDTAVPRTAGMASNEQEREYPVIDEAGDIPLVFPGTVAGSFDDGLPDTRLIPSQALGRAYRSSLLIYSHANRLHYGDPRGHPELREAISGMLNADRGLTTTLGNICLTRGSQMAIFVAARVLARPGETVAMDALTYPPAFHVFTNMGIKVAAVRIDRQGLDLDHLDEICSKTRISSIYLTPHHQFPTTVVMSPERRMRLLSVAEQYGFSIIEDDYDHDYNFDFKPLLPIASFAPSRVVYVGSFSKILAPSLRIGYVVAAKQTIDAIAKQIVLIDRQGDLVTEMAVAKIIESGEVGRHSRRTLGVYRNRRDVFASLLRANFGELINFDVPAGGLAFWIEFARRDHLVQIEERARSKGFRLLSSSSFKIDDSARSGLRLGFASKDQNEMVESIRALRNLIG